MAIAFDAIGADFDGSGNNSGFTGNTITCGSSATLLLFGLFAGQALTSPVITYNSVSATMLAGPIQVGTGTERIYIFGLLNPTTGSAIAPVISYTLVNAGKLLMSTSYSGTSTTVLPSTSSSSQGTGATSFTASLTTDSVANSWATLYTRNDFSTFTAGTGSTIRNQTAGNAAAFADSNGIVTASSAYTMAMSWGGSSSFGWIELEISPPTAAAATVIPIPQLLTTKVG